MRKKHAYSTGTSVPAVIVRRANILKLMKGTITSFFLFFVIGIAYAQVTIVGSPPAYYCGQVITLESPEPTTGNTFYWQSSGGVLLRRVGDTGTGTSVLRSITGTNRVEAIVNGDGKVTTFTDVNPTPVSIDLTPSGATLDMMSYTASTTIHPANGIQTLKDWICLSNNGSTETITITNPSPLRVFWVIAGGAKKVSETQFFNGTNYEYTVTITTRSMREGKGFVSAFIASPCGTFSCDPAVLLEVLKDIMPEDINGPTCLRDDNLDATSTVVYSIPDTLAGNAVYTWELYQNGAPVVDESLFKIQSQVLYGNSATIEYTGGTPSSVGNFSIKISNSCSSTAFFRDIIASPMAPNINAANNNYCVSNAVGTVDTIHLDSLLPGQSYIVTPIGNVNWDVVVDGNDIIVTFNDGLNGAVEVRVVNTVDAGCESFARIIYFNREGGTATIIGSTCIERGSTDEFSFAATPFGQYTWEITPALSSDYTVSSVGNVLTIIPPATGVDVSGNYKVTAALQGCAAVQTDTFDFEFGPEQPTITGETCLTQNTNYTYAVTSDGAAYAVPTITTAANGTVVGLPFTMGTPFNFDTDEDATISITSFSASGCASLPTVFQVKAKPVVTDILASDLCVNFNETPTITYTASTNGKVTDFTWSYPAGWTVVAGGGSSDNFVTLTLDATTAGDVCVVASNNGCDGDPFCLNVPRNALAITLVRSVIPAGTFGNPFPLLNVRATSTSGNPLVMNYFYGQTRTGINGVIQVVGGVEQVAGTPFNLHTTTSTDEFYSILLPPGPIANPWISLSIVDLTTGCSRVVAVEIMTIPEVPTAFKTTKKEKYKVSKKLNTQLDVNVYPNPVEDVLHVRMASDVRVIHTYLVDAKGNSIIYQSTDGVAHQKIDVSEYAKGMYYLGMVTNKGIVGKKIVLE